MSNTLAALLMGLALVAAIALMRRSKRKGDGNDDGFPPPPPPVPTRIDPTTGQVVPCPQPVTAAA